MIVNERLGGCYLGYATPLFSKKLSVYTAYSTKGTLLNGVHFP